MKWSIDKKITSQLVTAMAILALISAVSYHNMAGFINTSHQVTRAHEILEAIEEMVSQVKDAETGARGYLLTEDVRYLEPYRDATASVNNRIERLRTLIEDEPQQQRKLDRLTSLVAEKLEFTKETVETRRKEGFGPALELIKSYRGQDVMDEIRDLAAEMKSEEKQLLQQRTAAAEESASAGIYIFFVGTFLVFLLLLLVFYLLNREIAERKRAESALREITTVQRAILDSANYTIISTSPDGTIRTFNAAAERWLGHKAEEVIGKTTPAIIHDPEEIARRAKELSAEMGSVIEPGFEVFIAKARMGAPDENEWSYIRKDGSRFPVLLSVTALRDDNGEITGFLGIGSDITERRRAEEELRKSRERLQAILDNTTSVIYMKDVEGRYIIINRQYEELFHITRNQIAGKTDYDIFPKELADTFRKNDIIVIENGSPLEMEEAAPHDDGLHTYLSIKFPLLDATGSPYATCGISTDITHRKQAQERQDQLLKELESANQELNDFAYVISHDLKAPLRAIGSLASWIATDYADKFDEEGKQQMELLLGRVKRMHDLIEGVLQYSKVGRTREQKVEVDLNDLVSEVIALLSPPKNIEIKTASDLPTITCERTRIEQVFQNLLSNAIKFMDKSDGEITIACVEADGYYRFSVKDNGPGIDAKHFAKIFQIFQTLSPRDEFESTGIGLSVVKKTVDMYGGEVWVESKVGSGSTFFFTLPRQALVV